MSTNYLRRKISPFIQSGAIVLISVFFIASVIYAATTIGSNITTGGNLTVSGNATTTGNFIIGASSWSAPTSTLTVIGSAYINTKATTSDAFWIGTGGTANNINLAGGDLYVQNDAEIDGTLYGNTLTMGGNATTTGDLVIGSESATATSTLKIKSSGTGLNGGGCIEIANVEGVIYRLYVSGAGALVGPEAGNCK